MTHYIALVHKDAESGYGVAFADVLGVTAVADTLDDALRAVPIALGFAIKNWQGSIPLPRTLDQLLSDSTYRDWSADVVLAEVTPTHGMADAA